MSKISGGDAALYGFRFIQRDPLAVVLYVALYVALLLGITFAFGSQLNDALFNFLARLQDPATAEDPLEALSAAWALLRSPGVALQLLGTIIIGVMFQAAVLRVLTRDEPRGFANIGLGMDELRVLIAAFVVHVMAFIAMFIGFTLTRVATALGAGIAPALGVLLAIGLGIGSLVIAIWIGVRYSPAAALSVKQDGFYIFGASAISRPYFGSLLGAHVLAVFVIMLVALLISVIATVIGFVLGYNAMTSDLATPSVTAPGYVAYEAVSLIGTVITAALWAAVPAYFVAHTVDAVGSDVIANDDM
jgi:hypothetical protein